MRALFLSIALIILSALPAWATDILILQSSRTSAISDAANGFQAVYPGNTLTMVLADYAEMDVVRLVKEEQPRLLLVLGDQALAASRKVRSVPVVALMALAPLHKGPTGFINSIEPVAPPERFFALFNAIGVKRVGVLYDPARTGWYMKRAKSTAENSDVELITREVSNPRDVLSRLEQLKGKVDALWMIPDATVVTSDTQDAFFLFSLTQHVPVVTYADHYLSKGAAISLSADLAETGRQAAELTMSLLANPDRDPVIKPARKMRVRANANILKKLGIPTAVIEKFAATLKK